MNKKSALSAPNITAREQARDHQNRLTKPTGALGSFEDLALWLAGTQGQKHPETRPAALVLFASDHPVSRLGVSAYPREVTGAMVSNILAGGAASSVLCRKLGVPLYLWDVGVESDYEVPKRPANTFYHRGEIEGETGDLVESDALSDTCLKSAMATGRQAIDEVPNDTRIVLFGEMGIGNTTPASAVSAAILGRRAGELVGAGTGVAGEALKRKTEIVQKALDRCQNTSDALEILRRLGGREIAAISAATIRAAERGMAVLVDGFIVTAAVLVACRLEPKVRPWLSFAHCSKEAGHRLLLEELSASPLIDCGLRLGEGSGALSALALLDLAVTLHNEMATFEQADVPDRES